MHQPRYVRPMQQDRTCKVPRSKRGKGNRPAACIVARTDVPHACDARRRTYGDEAGQRALEDASRHSAIDGQKRATEQVDKRKQQGDQGRSAIHHPGQQASKQWVCTAAACLCPKRCNALRASQGDMVGRVLCTYYSSYHCSITFSYQAPGQVDRGSCS